MNTVIVFLMLAVVCVLLAGIVLMGVGGKLNDKYANKLMVARVTLQGLVLLLIAMLAMGGKK